MGKYLMAIDAGTGSARAVLFDTGGRQIAVSQSEWFHTEEPAFPGSMNFDCENGWKLIAKCVRDALAEAGVSGEDVVAVATTSMREAIVLYDKDGKELWACANVDARASDEVAQLAALRSGIESELYKISGQTFSLSALPRILWVKNHLPEIYEKVSCVNMLNDWIAYKLSGVLCAEPSNGCTSGIFDMSARDWQPEIAERCGLKNLIFPRVIECGTKIGSVSESAARETGLSENTIVVAGGGDAQLGCVGVGVVSDGQAGVFGGSFWQYEFNCAAPVMDEKCRVRVNCHAVPKMAQYEAIAFFPGLVMRWFRDAFGGESYDEMAEKAAHVPVGSNGVFCTFSDVMNYISWKHAAPAFLNFRLDAEKFNKYTFFRALMENAALVTRGHLELVSDVVGKKPSEIVFASGASKSAVWCQILADVLGVRVKVPVVREAAALGAAMFAGVGAGVFADIRAAAGVCVKCEREYAPDMGNNAVYKKIYNDWRKVYAAQMKLADEGTTSHMWKAPGLE